LPRRAAATPTRRIGPASRLALGGIGALVLIVALELLLRWAWPAEPAALDPASPQARQPYRYDPDLGWTWASLPEPVAEVNADGFRRRERVPRAPAEGQRRVVVLGDSQAQGAGVVAADSFVSLAEARLGPKWELLNAGVTGYRSLQVLRQLRRDIGGWAPEAVLVDCMPHDSPREDRAVLGRSSGWADRAREGLWGSRLWVLLHAGLAVSGLRSWESMPFPVQLPLLRAEGVAAVSEPGNLDLIHRWGEDRGVKVIFMSYPRGIGHVHCLTGPDDLPPGALRFDPCPALVASGLPVEALFFDVNHLRPAGHQIVAEALAAELPRLLDALGEGAPRP
jgi:hypothetical protein